VFSFNVERVSSMKELVAAVFACCLPFAMGGAYAQDAQKDEMKKEVKKGDMKKDAMGKDKMMKDMYTGGMMKDKPGKGGMKKDEKSGMTKEEMKQ